MKIFRRIQHPHDLQAVTADQKHKAVLEKRNLFWGAMQWRFVCTCGQGSLWVRTEKYAGDLADVHHDIILLEDDLREALERRAERRDS